MPRNKSGRASMADRHENILDATVNVIAEDGIRGLRLEEVANQADVAVSLIYYHFGNRIDLLRATFDYVIAQSPSTLLDGPDQSTAFRRVESAMVNEFTRPRARAFAVAWNEITGYAVFEPDMQVDIDATNRAWVASVKTVIELGQADRSIRSDIVAHDEAEILTSLLDGLVSRWISRSISVERATELIRNVLHDHLAGRKEKPA